MQAGLLNKTIRIYRQTLVKNQFGENESQFKFHRQTRARTDYVGGNRTESNDERVFQYSKTFKVYHYVDVVETDYIEYNGKKWRILSIEPIPERNEKIINTELINE